MASSASCAGTALAIPTRCLNTECPACRACGGGMRTRRRRPASALERRSAAAIPLSGAPSRAAVMSRVRLRTGLARRIQNGHVMAIDHLPALPSREQQDADDYERQDHTPRLYCGFGAVSIPQQEIDERNDDRGKIAEHMVPGIVQRPDSRLAEEIGKTGHSGDKCHHNPCPDQPHRGSRPETVARSNKCEVRDERSDQEGDGKWNQHWMQRVSTQLCCAHRINGHGNLLKAAALTIRADGGWFLSFLTRDKRQCVAALARSAGAASL